MLVGESWEIVDREEAQSVVHIGPLRGDTLHQLWTERREVIFGHSVKDSPRFPLLIKLLDARERLSVQVHPPASIAGRLGGEPKTEMWYFSAAEPEAEIFAGLKPGVTRESFEAAVRNGDVAEQIERFEVKTGDAIFIPSGRIHAIGAGNVIVEVQQNSDTTYRVFDWNRVGLGGTPRDLHIEESLESIDFSDTAPALLKPKGEELVDCAFFRIECWPLHDPRESVPEGEFAIFCCLEGAVECGDAEFKPGEFFLVPATLRDRMLQPQDADTRLLRITIPRAQK